MKLTPEHRKKLELQELRNEWREHLSLAFDSNDLTSRPTPTQMKIIKDSKHNIHYVLGSNQSGKSQLGARIVSWFFENSHPYIKRPEKWGDGPITILMVGRVGEQMESELWNKKIKPFLKEGTYKEIRPNGNLSRIENLENGNVIIFISHHDAKAAREKAQGYVAHVVWLDEMPNKVGILNELRMRVVRMGGFMYCTFTPLIKNLEIKKMVDSSSKRAKKWFMSALDNPYVEDKEELIAEYRATSASEAEFRARMYGEWMSTDSAVFSYDSELHFKNPEEYDPMVWPHILVVDPAVSGLAGVSVFAREPSKDVWYNVLAKKLKGSAFSRLVPEIEDMVSKFNIIRRICDCNPSGFYAEANKMGLNYIPVSDKSDKENSIDDTNSALADNTVYMTGNSNELVDELVACERSEINPEKIINASSFHTADTLRYFVRMKPKFAAIKIQPKPDEWVKYEWKKHLQSQQKRDITKMKKINRRSLRGRQRRA